MSIKKICATAPVSLGLVLALSGCSSLLLDLPSNDELLQAETGQNGRACIQQHDIVGFGMFDDDVISIDARGKNGYFLATTLYQCPSLQTSFAARFKGSFSQLCGGGRDNILSTEEKCPIRSIYKFESRKAAFAAYEKIEKKREDLTQQAKSKMEATKANAVKTSA